MSSLATPRLPLLLYLFPELSAFATVEDLVSHLRTSDAHYRTAALAGDHFLSLDPTILTIDLLEQHLLAAETSVVAVRAARGTPRTPFFEGTPGLFLLVRSAAAARARVAGVVAVASGVVVGAAVEVVEAMEVVAAVGVVAGVGASVVAMEAAVGVAVVAAVGVMAVGLELSLEVLEEARGSGSSVGARSRRPSSFVSGCFSVGLLGVVVAIFDLDYDAILSAMYALSVSAEGNSYRCVPPDPGIEAAALGASESSLPGTAPAEALHTFTLDSGASCYFFRDSTTPTPLPAPVPVRLADPSGGPVVARSSTVLPCPAVPSGSLAGLHLPLFSTNLVSTAALQDSIVTTTTPEVSASGQVAPPCSCRLLSHHTLLWHHRLGHPSLPRLRGMHSRLLVSGLPRSLPPLASSPAPPCLPCVEGRQRAAPHSSSFPPTTAPLQTLHMDVWGPARVSGQGRERHFVLAVDDYTQYTMVFPLRSKSRDLPVLCLHSDRGGEFSSYLLREFCRGEGILQSFTLPDSPQQNVIAECRIALVMEVARTSMIHAAAPHFLWPFAVRYAAHQLNLWPRVSLPETSPTLRWTGEVGDASVFRVWGSPSLSLPLCPPPPPPPPLFLVLGPPPVDPLLPHGPPPSGVSQVDPLPSTVPIEVAGDLGAAQGTASGGAEFGGAEPGGTEEEFLRTDTSLPPFYVLVYVDDLVFATTDTEALTLVKSELQKRHTCTDLGELRSYLGLQIIWDRARRTITLTHSQMVHQILLRFGFQFSSPQPTPLSTGHLLSAPPSDESVEPSGLYQELVGCLMYLMTCTRPDLAYPLSILARYVAPSRHQKVHWDAAKRVLRYLCSTSGMWLVLGGRGPVVLTGHADASWVDNLASQRSSQGYTFSLGCGSVSWQSTRSSLVLSSSCEAEIYAGAMAAQELRWLTYLLTYLGEQPCSPPILYVDNKAMIALCQEHRLEHRTKHVALRYFLA
ncbi:unnamed protein product [Closterium sp. NIES-53]